MPFGVVNAPAPFQELINKILYILRCRPLVKKHLPRQAETEANMDNVSLGTNAQEDHFLLLQEVFAVCQKNHLLIKLDKCELMGEEIKCLGFSVGVKIPALQYTQISDDRNKGPHHVQKLIGA